MAVGHTGRLMMRTGALFMDIPEYHDEQRLSDGGAGYGPMAYIFAMPTLDGFKDSVQFGSHGARGVLVGVVYVLRLPTSPTVLPTTYTDLSLAYGMNCVYLAFRRQATPNDRWKSYIKPANSDSTCTHIENPTALLPVKRISFPDHSGNNHRFEDYPPVARFDESANGKPLLGFKCVDGWCMIGLESGNVRPPMGGPGGREGRINGWHDEQVLTIRRAPGDFQGVFRAKLTPRPHLERVTLDTLQNWTHMATITLVGPPVGLKYSTWGMRRGDNRMELRLDPANSQWHARMIAPAFGSTPEDTTALRFVGRHSHVDVAVPATARFRWTLADDGIWVPCDLGCCKVEGVAS